MKTKLIFVVVFLTTLFVAAGCASPKYVATLGAECYHKPDCKYVEKSLHKHGKIKRLNYHSEFHKDLSGRKPCPKCIK
jgi:hypothetical protein